MSSCPQGAARIAVIGTIVLALMVAGCTGQSNDPDPHGSDNSELRAAAEAIRPQLEDSFESSYSGLTIDTVRSRITVYRRPDIGLEAFVRARIPENAAVFLDAPFTLAELRLFIARILGDATFWKARGIVINGAAPKDDGSGVWVMTPTSEPDPTDVLNTYYRSIPITARRSDVMLEPLIVPPATISQSPPSRP